MPTGKTLLERMREERDELDAAIRVIERMTGAARQAKAVRDVDVALAMATATSNGRGRPLKATRTWMAPATRARMNPPPKTKRKYSAARVKAKRQQTATLLARFDPEVPRPASVAGKATRVGVLAQHGYLARSGHGYIRTPKEFVP